MVSFDITSTWWLYSAVCVWTMAISTGSTVHVTTYLLMWLPADPFYSAWYKRSRKTNSPRIARCLRLWNNTSGTNRPKHLIKLFQRKWLWDEQWSVLGKAMKITFYMLPPHVISITAGHDPWTNFGWPYNLTYKPQAEQTHLNLGGRFLKSAERRQSRTGREEVSPL